MSAVSGDRILTVALDGEMGEGPVQAAGTGHGYRLTGTRTQVGYGPVADAFLVPAETDSGAAVFLVAAGDPGVAVTALATTGLGSVGHLELNGASGRRPQGRRNRCRGLARHAFHPEPHRFSARCARARTANDGRICAHP